MGIQLRRLDPNRNMARFYALTVQPTLFGQFALVREWGRIGSAGRMRTDLYSTPTEVETALEKLRRSKERRGYSPL